MSSPSSNELPPPNSDLPTWDEVKNLSHQMAPESQGPDTLNRLVNVLDVLMQVQRDLPVTWVATLLMIAKHEDRKGGLSIRELADMMGFEYSTTADMLKRLSPPGHRFTGALDLVNSMVDPLDERRKLLKLSDRGRKLVRRIAALNS